MLWVRVLGAILLWAPPSAITHRTTMGRGHSQINPKPCSVNGVEGTCMFVYECIKTEGKHVGMCVDNFMFGSCCSHNDSQNSLVPQHSQPNVLYSPTNTHSSLRPSSPTITTKPYMSTSNSKYRPAKPIPFVTRPTTHKPTTTSTTTSTTSTSTTTTKTWTAKPPYFITSHYKPSHHSSTNYVSQSLLLKPVVHSIIQTHDDVSSPSHTTTSQTTTNYALVATSKPSTSSTITWLSPSTPQQSSSTTMATSDSNAIQSWSSQKPSWTSRPSVNDITTSLKPGGSHSSKPDYWNSGKPNPYANRPSWQATTEPLFVTRPRPSSSLRPRPPKPTKKPILISLSSSSTLPSSTTDTSTTQSSTTTTSTTASSSTSTTAHNNIPTSSSITQLLTSSSNSSFPTTTMIPGASNYQYSGQCGVTSVIPRPEMRIVGGKNAAFGGWPWQVSVRRTSFFGFSSTHRCGGAVINENWIATAGHCVDDLLTSQIRIRVGEYDFSSVMEPYPFVERGVAKKVVHPKYNFFTYEYDLALVRLESPLEFQPHIAPICLPASDDLLIGENATVTGWGRLSEGGTLPSVLQQVSVPIVSNDKCKSMFLRAGRHEFIPDIFLCAGYENGGQDSCQGDSGGPLQVKGKNGRYFLAGIISWGIGCAEANLPGVCTRISKFVPWILENVT